MRLKRRRLCQLEGCSASLDGFPPAAKYCGEAHGTQAKRAQGAAYKERNAEELAQQRRDRRARDRRHASPVTKSHRLERSATAAPGRRHSPGSPGRTTRKSGRVTRTPG